MKSKLLHLMISIALISLLITACGPAATAAPAATEAPAMTNASVATEAPTTAPKPTIKMGLILKNLTNPYFVNMSNGAKAAAAADGIELSVLAPEQADNAEQQANLMDNLIQAKVDAIILTAANATALVPEVEKAKAAGIPVITADSGVNSPDVATFVGVDNLQLAVNIATWLKDYIDKNMGGKANIVILEGTPGSSSAKDRNTGFMQVLGNAPGITILASQAAKYNRVQSVQVTADILTRFPNVNIILAANDEMALGAIEAIQTRGLTPGKDIKVVGINAATNALDAMSQGTLLATISAYEYCMAYTATDVAYNLVKNGVQPDKQILGKLSQVVDSSNLDQFKQQMQSGFTCK